MDWAPASKLERAECIGVFLSDRHELEYSTFLRSDRAHAANDADRPETRRLRACRIGGGRLRGG